MKKSLTAAAVAATLIGSLGLVSAPAQAATPECNGATATIVVQSDAVSAFGTNGDDVIAIVGAAQARPVAVHALKGDDVICNISEGQATVFGDQGEDMFYGESIRGSYFYGGLDDDYGSGNSGVDTLVGGPGNDYLYGDGGSDVVLGGAGDDVVIGGPGTDVVVGGAGKDVIAGHGSESGDDKAVDKLYGAKSEVYPAGVGDKVYTKTGDLASYNATSKAAFLSKWGKLKDKFSVKNLYGGEYIASSVVALGKNSRIDGIWIAG